MRLVSAPTDATTPSRLSSLQAVATTRRGELGVRLVLALVGAGTVVMLGAPPTAAGAWFVAAIGAQAACLHAFRRFEDEDDGRPPTRIELAACHTTLFVACLWYSALAAPMWFEGGLPGRLFALGWVFGGLIHVTLHMPHDQRLLATALSAHALVLLGIPSVDLAIGAAADRPDAKVALAGSVLFLGHLVIALRKNGVMSAMLRAARERALEGQAAAEAASEAASRRLAAMTHELRGPVSGALKLAGRLLQTELAPLQRRQAETLEDASRMLLSQLGDILDFTRSEAGSIVLEEGDVDLRRLATGVTELWQARAEEKGVRLRAVVDADAPAVVRCDGRRLGQIISSLLANALMRASAEEIRLHVDAYRIDPSHAKLWIAVISAGGGVETAPSSDKLVDAFAQPGASSFGETGLGLALSRSIARRMGAEVTVSGRPGGNPRFTFEATLPVTRWPERSPRVVITFEGAEGGEATIRREDADIELEDVTGLEHWPTDEGWDRLSPGWALLGDGDGGSSARSLGAEGGMLALTARPPLLSDASSIAHRRAWEEEGEPDVISDGGLAAAPEKLLPSGLRICIVEDLALNRRVIEAALQRLDCDLAFAVDGEDALAQTSAQKFDVIFMDLHLPALDGFEVTRRIRAGGVNARTPIVGLTANVLPGVRDRCLAAGMDAFVSKPVDLGTLYQTVASVLERRARVS